jgi:hypothetical protein
MHAQCAAAAFSKHLEVSTGLRSFHNAKRVLLAGHWHIDRVVACDLEKDAAVGPAFVSLAS